MAGIGELVEDPDEEMHRMNYSAIFGATYMSPSPHLIKIPTHCPPSVITELDRASVNQWGDPAAAAMHIRGAVERLLDDLKVPERAEGKNRRLNLHERIELLRPERPQQVNALQATKWIGNAGAHGDDILRKDVFDMFDILEVVLDQIYGSGDQLSTLIDSVNSQKGPVRQPPDPEL